MRARYPDREGYVERDGVKTFYEVFGDGERRSCCFPPGRSCTPGFGRCRSRTWPATTASSPSTGAATAGPTGLAVRRRYVAAEYAADALAVHGRDRDRRAVVVSLSRGAAYSLRLNAAAPDPWRPRCSSAPTTPLSPFAPARLPYIAALRGGPRQPTRGGPRRTPPPGSGTTRVLGVLLRAGVPRASLHQADRGRHRLGPRHHGRDARRHEARRVLREATDDFQGSHRQGAVPVPGHPGHGGRHRRPRARARFSPPHSACGPGSCGWRGRATPPSPRPGEGQPPHPGVRRLAR